MSKKLWSIVSACSVYASVFSVSAMEEIGTAEPNKQESTIIDKISNNKTKKSYIEGKSVINETNSLAKITETIGYTNSKVLVICDIDRTILRQTNVALAYEHDEAWNYIQDRFEDEYPSFKKSYDYYNKFAYKTMEEVLLDDDWVNFIKDIKGKGCKVIAITAINNKKMYDEMLIDIRKEKLRKFGIDFSGSFDVASRWLGQEDKSPYYASGIITSLPDSKSGALGAFLKYAKYVPQKIVCIDDQKANLIDLNEFCVNKEIKFVGYEYTKAKEIPHECTFSYERAFFQLKYLTENNYFLTDTEADKLLKERNDKLIEKTNEFLERLNNEENIAPEETAVTKAEGKTEERKEIVKEEKGTKNDE